MQRLSSSLFNQPVVSLRNGRQIATATEPIIDPRNLKILGWHCRAAGAQSVLLAEDVRSETEQGLAVDDEVALSLPADLARHKEVLSIRFNLIGKAVKTHHQKIGKVTDFAYDDQSMLVEQLQVEPPMTKFFSNHDTRLIGRNQVREVTDSYILVNDTEVEADETEVETAEAPLAETA